MIVIHFFFISQVTCWVVHGLGASESMYMIKHPKKGASEMIKLSKQEVVDRYWSLYLLGADDRDKNSSKYDGYGFRTGTLARLMTYVQEQGVCLEKDWPWTGQKGLPQEKPHVRT